MKSHSDPTAKTILCVACRATFSEQEIVGASACPSCGSRGVPADLTKTMTATLTHHEWRIFTIWADNYAQSIRQQSLDEGRDDPTLVVAAICRELKRQNPDGPMLSLSEELQAVANYTGSNVEVVTGSGESSVVTPETKH